LPPSYAGACGPHPIGTAGARAAGARTGPQENVTGRVSRLRHEGAGRWRSPSRPFSRPRGVRADAVAVPSPRPRDQVHAVHPVAVGGYPMSCWPQLDPVQAVVANTTTVDGRRQGPRAIRISVASIANPPSAARGDHRPVLAGEPCRVAAGTPNPSRKAVGNQPRARLVPPANLARHDLVRADVGGRIVPSVRLAGRSPTTFWGLSCPRPAPGQPGRGAAGAVARTPVSPSGARPAHARSQRQIAPDGAESFVRAGVDLIGVSGWFSQVRTGVAGPTTRADQLDRGRARG